MSVKEEVGGETPENVEPTDPHVLLFEKTEMIIRWKQKITYGGRKAKIPAAAVQLQNRALKTTYVY